MSARRRLQRQVSPRTTVVVILLVLVAVQAAWWRGLVWRPPVGPGPPMGPGAMTGGPPTVAGHRDILVDTLAGTPEPGNADGPGRNARFDSPAGLAIDAQGAVYVADSLNDRIRRVEPNGKTSTVAGGERGFADGPVAVARFNMPCGVAVAPDGAVYVADSGNHRVRVIRQGIVRTLAGGAPGFADGAGPAARFNTPCSIAYQSGPQPALLVADALNHRVRVVSMDGMVQGGWAVAGVPTSVGASPPVAAVPQAGQFVGQSVRTGVLPIDTSSLDTPPKPGAYVVSHPVAICGAPGGWYVADSRHSAVFLVTGNSAEVLAGLAGISGPLEAWRDGTGDRCGFGRIGGLVADGKGHIYVSDTTNHSIRRITLAEAIPPGEEVPTESRDRRTDEGLRRWYLRDPEDQP